ncbi:MAG TPA: DUF445 domain-containing protein [Burkholderiaceae bacterium]|nr:DUF445 domain-containing protein [Burkholderiaceae bacterium]
MDLTTPSNGTEGGKPERLRRMRTLATALLLLMLVLLFTSSALMPQFPWLQWVHAFAEAGAVGAAADWYAVVALFRHPLGIPIPHTAIIPNNKGRIGNTLGVFVEENFLTPENVLRRIQNHNLAATIAQWLTIGPNREAVAQALAEVVGVTLRASDDNDLRRMLERALHPILLRLNVARLAAHLLEQAIRDERHTLLLEKALVVLEQWLDESKPLILAKFSEASRYTPPFLDEYIVNRFVAGIIALLREVVREPQHELRQRFDAATRTFIDELKTSDTQRRRSRAWMREIAAHLRQHGYVGIIWNQLRSRIEADLQAERSGLREQLALSIEGLGREVLADAELQRKLNAWWLQVVRELVLRFRHEASALIAEVVRSWDADEISRKVELEIGTDLQFIRINGTVVGGLVGVLLHAISLAVR